MDQDPSEAYEIALFLNNKYEIDGRDPNGYAGVAWCFGKHDRPWKEREIFGNVRFMNKSGLERKFNMDSYVQRVSDLS
jgi:deoxyribodipyrimidine photo-lyase